jgi:hypothetical protein
MPIETKGLVAKIVNQRTPKIVQGMDGFITVRVYYKSEPDEIYSFDGFSAATGYLKAATGSDPITLDGTLSSSDRGELKFDYAKGQSSGFDPGDERNLEIRWDDSEGRTIIQLEGKLSISEQYF